MNAAFDTFLTLPDTRNAAMSSMQLPNDHPRLLFKGGTVETRP